MLVTDYHHDLIFSMVSIARIRAWLYGISLCICPTFAVYAQTPPSSFTQAEQAIQRATANDADQYANELISLARQRLTQAQQFQLDRRQRRQAPLLASQAAADADLAYARSQVAILQSQISQCKIDLTQLRQGANAPDQGDK